MTMRARGLHTWLTATVSSLVVLGACGVSDDSFRTIDDDEVPYDLGQAGTTVVTVPGTTAVGIPVPVVLWFVEGQGVRAITRPSAVVGPADVVTLLATGPVEGDPDDVRTAITPELVTSVDDTAPTTTVDLAPTFPELAPTEQLLAVAQIVLSITSLPTRLDVVFTIDGTPVGVPRGDGTISTEPVGAVDYRTLVGA